MCTSVSVSSAPGTAAGPTGQCHDGHVLGVRCTNRSQHVARIAAGADRDEHVAGIAQRLNLLRVDRVEVVVVPDRGEYGRVRRQRQSSQPRALAFETANELGSEMGIAGRIRRCHKPVPFRPP